LEGINIEAFVMPIKAVLFHLFFKSVALGVVRRDDAEKAALRFKSLCYLKDSFSFSGVLFMKSSSES
jgi:hypothetical protein